MDASSISFAVFLPPVFCRSGISTDTLFLTLKVVRSSPQASIESPFSLLPSIPKETAAGIVSLLVLPYHSILPAWRKSPFSEDMSVLPFSNNIFSFESYLPPPDLNARGGLSER